ncbi:hypothetical protein EIP86_002714 [Pleurotus ostreatoroseus]|nr:hypothetical protein EIP86_002714 [Pleurotus ostreatoroseus]
MWDFPGNQQSRYPPPGGPPAPNSGGSSYGAPQMGFPSPGFPSAQPAGNMPGYNPGYAPSYESTPMPSASSAESLPVAGTVVLTPRVALLPLLDLPHLILLHIPVTIITIISPTLLRLPDLPLVVILVHLARPLVGIPARLDRRQAVIPAPLDPHLEPTQAPPVRLPYLLVIKVLKAPSHLLIGINYVGQQAELRGCINDANNVKRFLCSYYGYREEDIVMLTDDTNDPRRIPTKQNMLQAMQWLVNGAQPNDSLFFHYSGHGGQTKDVDGDEADGFDEVIYPVDFKQVGHIVDDVGSSIQ